MKFEVNAVVTDYHTVMIEADSFEQALDKVRSWKSDKQDVNVVSIMLSADTDIVPTPQSKVTAFPVVPKQKRQYVKSGKFTAKRKRQVRSTRGRNTRPLTDDMVINIFNDVGSATAYRVAKKYGVAPVTVQRIKNMDGRFAAIIAKYTERVAA